MGIDYQAAVIIGLPQGEIINKELIEEEDLSVCSPCYDGGGLDYAIAGFFYSTSDTYGPSKFVWDQEKVNRLMDRFRQLTGQEPKLWISPYGY